MVYARIFYDVRAPGVRLVVKSNRRFIYFLTVGDTWTLSVRLNCRFTFERCVGITLNQLMRDWEILEYYGPQTPPRVMVSGHF